MKPLRVRYLGPFAAQTGLAVAAHDYLLALHRAGVELEIEPIIPGTDIGALAPRYHELLRFVQPRDDNWPNVYVVHTIPPYVDRFAKDEYAPQHDLPRVANTVWETYPLPARFAKPISDSYDKIIVPSGFNRAAFIEGGVPADKLAVVPHCYDPAWWLQAEPPPNDPSEPFTFYSILVWAERKHPIGLLKAYFAEFRSHEKVRMVLVCPQDPSEDIEALKTAMRLGDYPDLQIVGQAPNRLDDLDMMAIHAVGDCYVTTTRGEAWGLGAFEAAIMGSTVIAPKQGGQMEFLDHYPNTMYMESFLTPATGHGAAVEGIISGEQLWAEPDLAACRRLMRIAYEARDGKRPSEAFRERYSYQTVGAEFRSVLESLL